MLSIGALSKQTGVKVSTIRYYEQVGLLNPPIRTQGNQRRYPSDTVERLGFIRHARELGFSIEAIAALIELNGSPNSSCAKASRIAREQLEEVRVKIAGLVKLESELSRIANGCGGSGVVSDCYVMASLADHSQCRSQH